MEEICMVRRITFSGPSHRQACVNTRFSEGNPGSWLYNWTETSRWLGYYNVGNAFMEHIRAYNCQTTILDTCVVRENHFLPVPHIYVNSNSGGV